LLVLFLCQQILNNTIVFCLVPLNAFFQWQKKQAEHRQGIENRVIGSDTRNSMLGLIFGFLIGALGLGCGFFLIFNGMLVEGSIFGGATLASLVTTFIYGSQQRRRERELKQ